MQYILLKNSKAVYLLKITLIIIFILYQRGLTNYSLYLIMILERPYLITIKKGLTYVGPGDGEPYF